jgi:hypothetical protein
MLVIVYELLKMIIYSHFWRADEYSLAYDEYSQGSLEFQRIKKGLLFLQ